MRFTGIAHALVTAVSLLAIRQVALADSSITKRDCSGSRDPHVFVDLDAHRLYLCRDAIADGDPFPVRLGSRGVGKTRSGDKKTPLGVYVLGPIRHSRDYGWFIPIGYPTPLQRKRGYTGNSVGLHGPDRRLRWLGRAVNWFDTTDGCVGLASDDVVLRISNWINANRATVIRLR